MRVAQLVPSLDDGGVERSVLEMAERLSAEGTRNWVVSAGGRLLADLAAAGAGHLDLDIGRKSPVAIWRASRRLARWLETERIDIVHARSRAPAWVGSLACARAAHAPRFITTFHGVYGHRSALKRRYNSGMLRGPLVIANSQFIADHLRVVYDVAPERLVLAPRGVDPARFDPARVPASRRAAIRAEFGSTDRALLVIVARISRWKGHMLLLDALRQLADLPWSLAVVGAPESQSVAEALAARAEAHPFAGRVHFAGSRTDVPDLLAAADLAFSVATEPEAFGRAVIEAGAMETAVVGTDHGGTRETLRDGQTGWAVPPNDAAALAAAIRAALEDPSERAARGRAGRAHVLARFTTQRTLDAEIGAYHRLLADGESPA